MWIVSQIIGVVALIVVIIAFQKKRRLSTLLLSALANGVSVVMHLLLTNWVMAGFAAAVSIRALVYAFIEPYRLANSLPRWLDYIVLVAMLAVNGIVFIFVREVFWFDYVLLGGTMFATFGGWRRGIHWIRFGNIVLSAFIIVNAIMFVNVLSIITESFIILAILAFYVRIARAKRNISIE